jgi:hypothetical protein
MINFTQDGIAFSDLLIYSVNCTRNFSQRIDTLICITLVALNTDTFEIEVLTAAGCIVFSDDFDASLAKCKIFS